LIRQLYSCADIPERVVCVKFCKKDPGHADPRNGGVIPPEPPVVVFLPAGTERSAQGRAVFGAA
jgi:hypothetical protein